jgi:hypothetical protein
MINILRPFFAELTEQERLYGVFWQDSTTAHTAHISLEALRKVLGDRVIRRGLWHPGFPDLTNTLWFLFVGKFKRQSV